MCIRDRPKWKHVGTKIASKSTSCQKRRKALWYWKSYYFFNRIRFPGTKKTIQNPSKIIPKLKSRWEGLLARIFSPFYTFFRAQDVQTSPKWLPKDAKKAPKTLPRRFPDLQEAPKIPPRPSKMPSRRPKTSLRRSERLSRAAKTAKMTPKTPPRHEFERFWEPKWKHVGTKIASKSISCQKRRKALWY